MRRVGPTPLFASSPIKLFTRLPDDPLASSRPLTPNAEQFQQFAVFHPLTGLGGTDPFTAATSPKWFAPTPANRKRDGGWSTDPRRTCVERRLRSTEAN
jgi:hypothetical protein